MGTHHILGFFLPPTDFTDVSKTVTFRPQCPKSRNFAKFGEAWGLHVEKLLNFCRNQQYFYQNWGNSWFLEHLKAKVTRLIQKTSYILGVLFSDKWMYIDCEQHPFPVYKQFREMVFWAWLNKKSYHSVEHGLKKNQHMSTLPVSWLQERNSSFRFIRFPNSEGIWPEIRERANVKWLYEQSCRCKKHSKLYQIN